VWTVKWLYVRAAARKLLDIVRASIDAATYLTELPKAEHDAAEWQAAMATLLLGERAMLIFGVTNEAMPTENPPDRRRTFTVIEGEKC
jgi:hypothetical protein